MPSMTLTEWLATHEVRQAAFAEKVGLTQGRISQIAANGTRDMPTAMRISDATGGEVTLSDLLPREAAA